MALLSFPGWAQTYVLPALVSLGIHCVPPCPVPNIASWSLLLSAAFAFAKIFSRHAYMLCFFLINSFLFSNVTSFLINLSRELPPSFCPFFLMYFVHKTLFLFIFFIFCLSHLSMSSSNLGIESYLSTTISPRA